LRILLHIGVHKTGSTALQGFFAANRLRLLEHGILYPQAARWPEDSVRYAHHRLPWSLLRPDRVADPWPALRRELAHSAAEVAILSAERFEGLRRDDQLTKLGSLLADHEVTVIVYLRRQDEYLHGDYCTRIVHNGEDLDFEAYKARKTPNLDYRKLLERWERRFGREALVVRPYERSQLADADIVADFAAGAGIELPEGLRGTARVNRSYPKNVIDAFRRLWRLGIDPESIASCKRIAAWAYQGRRVDADVMSPAERAELLGGFEASNSFVAREYLGREDGVLFRDRGVGDQDAWDERYRSPDSYLTTTLRDLGRRLEEARGARALPGSR